MNTTSQDRSRHQFRSATVPHDPEQSKAQEQHTIDITTQRTRRMRSHPSKKVALAIPQRPTGNKSTQHDTSSTDDSTQKSTVLIDETDLVVAANTALPIEKRSTVRLPPHSSRQRAQHDTSSSKVIKAIARLEQFATVSVQTVKDFSRLDRFGTLPVATVQGLAKGEKQQSNIKLRLVCILCVLASFFYLTWLYTVLNRAALWLSIPYFLVSLYVSILLIITTINNWRRSIPQLVLLPKGQEPMVAVLIPTYGEPVEMTQITIESVLQQDWPHKRLIVVVGDDSHRPEVNTMVKTLQYHFPLARLIYHEPPRKGSPDRHGSAKDGNLNSMLSFVTALDPNITYIETRDADDLVGDPHFLRYAIGYLQQYTQVSYVQSIKDTLVSQGDPFGNRQSLFYRGIMQSRHASNAIFPCGSGLVWRKPSLFTIGGFPTWNLVEDLYSGYLAMKHGLKGAYLPIVGAVGQTSPEDIPNVYKQLGTWALDTMRLCIWKNPWFVKGFTFAQRMQFTELALFYILSIPLLVFALTSVISLFTGIHPFIASNLMYVLHFWIYAIAIELLLVCLGDKTTFDEIWRAREIWIGMIFVFVKAALLALVNGPNKKPVYRVTRKVQQAGLYVREVLLQLLLLSTLALSILYHVMTHWHNFLASADIGSIFWASIYLFLLGGMIRKSWFGFRLTKKQA